MKLFITALVIAAAFRFEPDPKEILTACITATQNLSSYKCHVTDSSSFGGVAVYDLVQERADVKDIQFGKSLYAMSGYVSHDPSEKKTAQPRLQRQ